MLQISKQSFPDEAAEAMKLRNKSYPETISQL